MHRRCWLIHRVSIVWMCLIVGTTASCISSSSSSLTPFSSDGNGYNAGAWSPDGQQLIVARASDGALMSLDIAKLLKAKRVKP